MRKIPVCIALLGLLAVRSALAQPARSAPPGAVPPAVRPAPAPALGPGLLGRSYRVTPLAGNGFIGVLRSATAEELTFETTDQGALRVPRATVRRLTLLSPRQARRNDDDVGNGDHLFFAPTARNLRRGEGYAQDLELFVVRGEYGITDQLSVGALVTVIPGQGTDNVAMLTPKASVPVGEKVRVGAGALLIGSRSGAGGVGYANATYGTADTHLTLGLGYGFSGNSGFINTPLLVVGGAVRVARRVSLLNESYLLRDRSFIGDPITAVLGIAGVRVAGRRIGGGLGVFYAYANYHDSSSSTNRLYQAAVAYPFAEVTFRFGRLL